MKNFVVLILLLALGCSSATDSNSNNQDTIVLEKLPEIGEQLHDSIIRTSNNRGHLVTSGQFWPSTTIRHHGILFNLVWNESGNVKYISTGDTNFITDENLRVNMTLNEIEGIELDKIQTMPGWGYYFELKSGWSAGLCVVTDNGCTGRELLETDTVKWFFKRGGRRNVVDTSFSIEKILNEE